METLTETSAIDAGTVASKTMDDKKRQQFLFRQFIGILL
jgi:hypothetical protein